jgi:hypothetical protein
LVLDQGDKDHCVQTSSVQVKHFSQRFP